MNDSYRILVVDDDPDLCEILRFNLTVHGYQATVVNSAVEAMQLPLRQFHLILLDVMMPDIGGFEFARMLKQNPDTSLIPIIFLTAKSSENDMLSGFGVGADDYITKPFSIREVLARVKAVIGRTMQALPEPVLQYEGLVINTVSKTVTVDGEDIMLTKTEFELLYFLFSHKGEVFSRQQLIDKVWPENVVVSDRTVDVNITRMRKKIGNYASLVVSRMGYGYAFMV